VNGGILGPVIVAGVYFGALYALSGMSLAVVYRSSGVLNFGLGGIGTLATYSAYGVAAHHLPVLVAVLIAVAVGGILGLIVEVLLVRPLRSRDPLVTSIATFSVILLGEGVVIWLAGTQSESMPSLASLTSGPRVLGLLIPDYYLVVLGIALVVMAAILYLLRTDLGISMRATSSGARTAQLLGVNTSRVSLISWGLGGAIGGLAGVLAAPSIFVAPDAYTEFGLTVFVAVVLGGFTSTAGILIGAILYGVGISFVEYYLPSTLTSTYTFVLLAILLTFKPHGILGRQERRAQEPDLPPERNFRLAARRQRRPQVLPVSRTTTSGLGLDNLRLGDKR